MKDLELSATSVGAWILWLLAVGFVVVSFWTRMEVAALGCVTSAGAAVLTIRGFFCSLVEREKVAFDLGQESVRSIR